MPPPIILTVDDELQVSNAIERDLRQHYHGDYRQGIQQAVSMGPTQSPITIRLRILTVRRRTFRVCGGDGGGSNST